MAENQNFNGYRIYNGCPDSSMQERINKEYDIAEKVKRIEPEATCTYFPMEQCYVVHIWGRNISKTYGNSFDAWVNALNRLLNLGETLN